VRGEDAHGVTDQGAVLDLVVLEEVLDVLSKSDVVVARVVRRVTMVS